MTAIAPRRSAAVELFIDRASLPVAAANETYVHDLVGLTVVTRDGSAFGKVVDVVELRGRRSPRYRAAGEATVLVPFSDAFVPDVDIAAGRLTIDLPEGYLDET